MTKSSHSTSNSIGTKNESSLHRSLKNHYAYKGNTEKKHGSFVCDAISSEGEAIEIQTGNFAALKKKLPLLAKQTKVRLIYPLVINKIIELYDNEGQLVSRRKSPKKGLIWDIFNELIYAPGLIGLKNLTIEIVLVDAVERRRNDGKGSWRRKGISIEDRSLDQCRENIVLRKKTDWRRQFLTNNKEYTTKDLAMAVKISPALARKTLYTLEKAGILEKKHKIGRSWLYISS